MLAVVALLATSCKDYLDINTNQNKPTNVSAPLVLSQALVATGIVINQYNTYGMQTGGYAANAGGFGGFNETVTYLYTNNNYSNLWPTSYDNLEDYQYIINQTQDEDGNVNPDQIYFNAIARIMKSYGFQLLVDAYNNVPYSEALLGDKNLTPAYDDPAAIYAALAADLDKAIADINAGNAAAVAPSPVTNYDVVFAGKMTSWIKFANTIKLRLMIRGKGKVTFTNTTFDAAGFVDKDVKINPGYTRDINRQNPNWNSWAFGYTGSSATKAWVPSTFVMGFYDGHKLVDLKRGNAMYYQFPSTGTNQLGYEGVGIPKSPEGNFWYPSDNRDGKSSGNATGVLKGPEAGLVAMTAAESYFLQAEALLEGIPGVTGTQKGMFEAGIHASFKYLYLLPDNTTSGTPDADADAYIAANTNYLVQYDLATSDAQRLEAIITQKWLAVNMINSQEGYNEYRRTGYPKVNGALPNNTFASLESLITSRPDRLPTRILYPVSEVQYNGANVPAGVTSTSSTIFWAK